MKQGRILLLYFWELIKKIVIPKPSYLFTQIFFVVLLIRLFVIDDNPWLRFRAVNDVKKNMTIDTLIVTGSDFSKYADAVGRISINGYLKNDSKKTRGLDYSSTYGHDQYEIESWIVDSTVLNGLQTPIIPVYKDTQTRTIYPVKDKEYIKEAKSGLIGDIIIFLIIVPLHFFLRIILFTIKFIKNAK